MGKKDIPAFYSTTSLGTLTAELSETGEVVRILKLPESDPFIMGAANEEDMAELRMVGVLADKNPSYLSPDLEGRIEEVGTFRLNLGRLNELLETKKAKFVSYPHCEEYSLELL